MKFLQATCTLLLLLLAGNAAAINVFACEPEWGSLVGELAGDLADTYVATTAAQDPHRIEARPSLIAEVRDADLMVCSGAELEVGWLPLLLRRSGNRAIQPGEPGHFLAADHVRRLEVPQTIDRSQGDIHPQGNPHVHLDPHNIRRIARALSARLQQIDGANAATYAARLADFDQRWREATGRWEAQASALAGLPLISHHRAFSYLANWLGLNVLANIEPKPGIPPSSAHLARLLADFEQSPPHAIVRTPYEDPKPSDWLSERLDAPAITLPYTVGPDTPDLFALFERTLEILAGTGR